MKRQRLLRAALVSLSAVLLSASQALATTFYVDGTNGNNANAGTTWATAKKTIQAAVNVAMNGDQIQIAGGASAAAVYDERVLVNEKTLTLTGRKDNTATTGADESSFSTIIRPSSNGATYTEATLLSWSGFPSTTFEPVVFGQFSTNTFSLNVYNLTIDANRLATGTRLYVGLAIKNGNGTIGASDAPVYVTNIREAIMSNYNGGFGILIYGKSQAKIQYTTVDDYQTAGILVAGNSTSTLASTIASQPQPTIENCIIRGIESRNNANSYIAGVMSVHGGRGYLRSSLIYRNYNYETWSAGSERNSYGYGVYLSDARNWTVGDLTVKGRGNVITENEIGVFAEITVGPSTISPSLYQIRQNNIYRNGGAFGVLYLSSTGSYFDPVTCTYVNTTIGNIRYRNSGTTSSSSLSVQSNAWGNADIAMFSKSTPNYTPATYDATPVAFWQETIGDVISAGSPLVSDTISYKSSYTYLSGFAINYGYGYTQFPTLNDAVAAASPSAGQIITVPVGTIVLREPLRITKKVILQGAAACTGGSPSGSSMATLQLEDNLHGPTIWVQGMSTAAGDPITRTPDGVEIRDLYIIPADMFATAANLNWGIAFTGAFGSANPDLTTSPTNTKVKGVKMSSFFNLLNLYAMVTDIDGVANVCERVSKGATSSNRDIDAKITFVDDCDSTSLTATDVYDDADEPGVIARIIYDNTIYVATCAELQAALDLAASDPVANTPMNIIVTAAINNCTANYNVNGGGNVVINTQVGGSILFNQDYPLNINSNSSNTGIFTGNQATYPGGTAAACKLVIPSAAVIAVERVNVWPPACLQTAVDVVAAGNTNTVYAAQGNGTTSPLAFTETNGLLNIAKNFDFYGVSNVMSASGNATFTGKFMLFPETSDGDVGVGVYVAGGGTVTSTRGAAFADGDDQVELKTNTAPDNSIGTTVNMALQFISTTGSRGLLLDPAVLGGWNENPLLNKRVHLHGTSGRNAVFNAANTIILNGSGDCNNPSLIKNVSIATIIVNSNGDCIQTALGTGANQDVEGVGTVAVDGSGGIINLNNVANWVQDLDIGKSVTFVNQGGGTTSGVVNMRRGANVTGGLTDFTNTVNLNQNPSWATAANPDPSNALPIVSANGTMNIAGYGRGIAVGTGNAAGGPWDFSNVNINKALNVYGFYNGTCANDNTTCVADGLTPVPGINSGRTTANETVIGFSDASASFTNQIFIVSSNNVSVKGFYFDNIGFSGSAGDRYVIASAVYSNGTISNNIVDISVMGSVLCHGFLNMRNGFQRQNWTVDCNRMFGDVQVGLTAGGYRAHFIEWNNNGGSAGTSVIRNNVVLTEAPNDQIVINDMVNAFATGLVIEDNYFSSYTGTLVTTYSCVVLRSTLGNISGVTVQKNVIQNRAQGILVELNYFPSAITNIDIKHNFITNNTTGVQVDGMGNYTALNPNNVRVNNNYITGNSTRGVYLAGVGGGSTGKVDIGLNWWGGVANLGPTRGANVSAAVQPFAAANGDPIVQDAAGAGDVFTTVLPFYVSGTDQITNDCGWNGGPIIGPVLRMATGGAPLLGVYPTITDARDNTNCALGFTCNPTRTNTDEIWVIGGSGSGAYPSATSPEAAYPVLFDADPQPSTVLGINGAVIRHTDGGAIKSTTRTNGFTVKDLTFNDASIGAMDHVAVWLGSGDATVLGNTFNSASTTGNYVAVRADGGGTNMVQIGSSVAGTGNTITYTGTNPSTGIYVSGGFTSGTVHRNTVSGIFSGSPSAASGASIYIGPGNSGIIAVGGSGYGNTIQGNATGNGSNGIVLDAAASTITIDNNTIGTTTSLRSTGVTGIDQGGFGILVNSSSGTANIGNLTITNNTIGGAGGAGSVDQAGIFVGGTTGSIGTVTIGSAGNGNTIRGVRDAVGTAAGSNAAIAIATFGGTPTAGNISIGSNTIGGTSAGEGNKTDLIIGSGSSANNLRVDVQNNNFRSNTQTIEGNSAIVQDFRTNAGANIRNIFGNTNGSTITGAGTAGNGTSGNNTFSYAAILTSSTNLQDYAAATVRTADAVSLIAGYTAIYRTAQTPLSSATNTNNTVELRENATIITADATSYYNETLTFPDFRCMLLGPTTTGANVMTNANQHANIYAGDAGVDLISTGRENKDVRGGITLHATGGAAGSVNATGIYGRIPQGGNNKGDVYMQGAAVGADNGYVRFAYDFFTLGSQTEMTDTDVETTGGNDIGDRGTSIIKAGLEDANDDAYAITGNQHRRTGVFTRGNGTQFTKPVEGPITGEITGVYPNPASGDATLRYSVPASGDVTVGVFNALGVKVSEYVQGAKSAGVYTLDISASELPIGSYTVRVTNGVPGYSTPMTITVPLQIIR
ncbi:hypothetical protein MASR2M18_09710 [Ignavibacteria bacterium]